MRRGRMDKKAEVGRFVVSLWRCDEHPGGMDWIDKCTTMLMEREATARAEALREAAERAVQWLASQLGDITTELHPKFIALRKAQVASLTAAILADKQEENNV
jgi:hypothetical protein